MAVRGAEAEADAKADDEAEESKGKGKAEAEPADAVEDEAEDEGEQAEDEGEAEVEEEAEDEGETNATSESETDAGSAAAKVAKPSAKGGKAEANLYQVLMVDYGALSTKLGGGKVKYTGLSASLRPDHPVDFAPVCVVVKVAPEPANSSTSKADVYVRVMESLISARKLSETCIMAFFCSSAKEAYIIGAGLVNRRLFTPDPIVAKWSDGSATYIVLGAKNEDIWKAHNEKMSQAGSEYDGDPNNSPAQLWRRSFSGSAIPSFFQGNRAIPFTLSAQLDCWFLRFYTLPGDAIWCLNSPTAHLAMAAITLGRFVLAYADNVAHPLLIEKLEAVTTIARHVAEPGDVATPDSVFTVLKMAESAQPVTVSCAARSKEVHSAEWFIKGHVVYDSEPWLAATTKPGVLSTFKSKHLVIKKSNLVDAKEKSVGLGVFTTAKFKKGADVFGKSLVGHFICEGFIPHAASENKWWRGWPWSDLQLPGLSYCSSVPQYFDYINDPLGLKDSSKPGVQNSKANIKVRTRAHTYTRAHARVSPHQRVLELSCNLGGAY
jgi:hypothetical protein